MDRLGRAGAVIASATLAFLGLVPSAEAATITPTVFFDGMATTDNCTLREAVQASNTNAPVDACEAGQANKLDTIALSAGEYNLTIDGDGEDQNETGDLDVTPDAPSGPLRIQGEGIGVTTIDAEHDDRVIHLFTLNIEGSLTVADLTALGNDDRELSGGVIASNRGELKVQRVEVANGHAQFGGGIACGSCDKVRITETFVHDNRATAPGTGSPGVEARGGGISVSEQDVVISDTTVTDNEAVANDSVAIGGGIYGNGEVAIRGTFIGDNTTRSSTNNAISTRAGGGVYIDDDGGEPGIATISNTTMAGNSASSNGAASQGGAIAVEGDTTMNVFGATLADNIASQGQEVHARNGATANVGGSILASIGNGQVCAQNGGTIRSKGFNVLDDQPPLAAACMDGPKSAKDEIAEPNISFVATDNGGPTFTYVISDSSPAVNLVPKRKCRAAGKTDQRGVERPSGKGCDAGGYERAKCGGIVLDEDAVYGTPGKDVLTGSNGAELFAPSAGADILVGLDGDDRMCAGSSNDKLKGGEGADTLDGGKGEDNCNGGPGNDSGKSCEKRRSL